MMQITKDGMVVVQRICRNDADHERWDGGGGGDDGGDDDDDQNNSF